MENEIATLKITYKGSRSLGRCDTATTWRIESRRPLAWKDIQTFRGVGLLGGGQEFFGKAFKSDGSQDLSWEAKWEPGRTVYTYEVEDRVDSSD